MTDRNYEILEHIAVLSESASGWRKELTLTKWFDNEPKYDIRDWSSDYGKCGKGVTLSNDELNVLMECKSKLEDLQRQKAPFKVPYIISVYLEEEMQT